MTIQDAFAGVPSPAFKNPFDKTSIDDITIYCKRSIFDSSKINVRGYVEFRNGNTSGRQDFKGNTFAEVYQQILNFVNSLE